MSKSAFKRPQQKPRTPAPSIPRLKTSSDISAPSDEDDAMVGKLLEEVEEGETQPKKASKTTAKPKPKVTPKPAVVKKKSDRPSLPSLEEIQAVEPVEDKQPPRKTNMRRVGSFDVDASKKVPRKAAVVYNKRNNRQSQSQAKSKATIESDEDEQAASDVEKDPAEVDPEHSSQSSLSEIDPKKRKQPPNTGRPAEVDKKKSKKAVSPGSSIDINVEKKQATSSVSPKHQPKKVTPSSPHSDSQLKNAKKKPSSQESASSDEDEDDDDLLLPAPRENPGQTRSSPASSQRPSRAAKTQGSKRLTELAEYNIDAVEAEEGGSAGVLLDALDIDVGPKSTQDENKGTTAKSDEGGFEIDMPASSTQARSRRKIAESSPVVDHKAKKQKPNESTSPSSANQLFKTPQNPLPKSKTTATPNQRQKKEKPFAIPTPELEKDSPSPTYDKQLILRMLVAKLESTKTCDWYELSAQLNKEGIGAGLAKKGKKGEAPKISGDQLYELYHNVVLPGLKVGRALWRDDASAPSPDSDAIVTPQLEDLELPQEYESEEEEIMPSSTKSKPIKAKK